MSMGIDALVQYAGISHRQADHWTRKGYISSENPECGQGHARRWSLAEAEVAAHMRIYTAVGIDPAAAARAARNGGTLGQVDGAVVTVTWSRRIT